MITKNEIVEKLRTLKVLGSSSDIISSDVLEDIQVNSEGGVQIVLKVDPKQGSALEPFRQDVEREISTLSGVKSVAVILTAEKPNAAAPTTNDPHGMNKNPKLEHIPAKKIIAVASGKGGVGKSTVSVNIAVELARQGYKVGLLDADIYGPSIPRLTGLPNNKPDQKNEKIIPFEAYGLQVMSIGFLVEQEQALIWRGPMVQTALYQMFRDVAWGYKEKKLDYLIVDMPPGTGDAQLTLAQKIPVAGAIIVSTPQDLALIDARKAIEMFRKVEVPILGLVENMSTFICPKCGHEEHIFGHQGAKQEAEKLSIPYLGDVPLQMQIREQSDNGQPLEADHFKNIVNTLIV